MPVQRNSVGQERECWVGHTNLGGGQFVGMYMSFDYATTRMLGTENHVCEVQVDVLAIPQWPKDPYCTYVHAYKSNINSISITN